MCAPLLSTLLPGKPWVTYVTAATIAFVSYKAEQDPRLKEQLLHDADAIARGERYRMFSSTLVHGGYAHLIMNLFPLVSFGPLLELSFRSTFGSVGGITFASALVALLALEGRIVYEVERRQRNMRSLGASGMVLAVFAAVTVLHPMTGIVLFFILPMKAWLFLALFLAFTIWAYRSPNAKVDAAVSFGVSNNIHHLGHLIGMILGILLGGIITLV